MRKIFLLAFLLFVCSGRALFAQTPPLATNVAPNCTNMTTCTYTDTAVPPGQHFYFAVAVNSQTLQSVGSNSFNVTVPSGTHNVVLNWTPSASGPSGISYSIYRGAPPTNVAIGIPSPPLTSTGWTYQQDVFHPCTAGTSSCVANGGTGQEVIAPTTAGSTRVIVMQNGPTNIHITSIGTGATGENWQHAAGCQVFNSTFDAEDVYYSIGGSGGNTSYTVNTSGNFVDSAQFIFAELIPPPGFTSLFDVCGANTQSSCTTCTGVSLPLGGTDAVLEIFDTANMVSTTATNWNAFSSPFITDPSNDGVALNVSGNLSAPTFTQASAGFNTTIAIAFKSTAGIFSVTPTPIWTMANYSEPNFTSGLITCNRSCTFHITQPTVGDLLFLNFSTLDHGVVLNSVSDPVNGAWTIPPNLGVLGGNTSCNSSSNTGQAVSVACAYVLASAANCGNPCTISVTLNTSEASAFSVWEAHRTSGNTALDAAASAVRATATQPYPPGITFSSLSGTNDACFQAGGMLGGVSGTTIYPYAGGSHAPSFGGGSGAGGGEAIALLNTANGTGPVWPFPGFPSNITPVYGVCFK